MNIAVARTGDDLRTRALTALLVAGQQPDAGAEAREALSRSEAEP